MQILWWLKSSTPLQGKLKSSLPCQLTGLSFNISVSESYFLQIPAQIWAWSEQMNWPGHGAALPRTCGVHTLSFLFILAPFLIRRKTKTAHEALTYRKALNHTCVCERGENLKLFLNMNSGKHQENQIKSNQDINHICCFFFSTCVLNTWNKLVYASCMSQAGRAQDNCCLLWIHSKHSVTYSCPHMSEIKHFMDSDRAGWDIKWPFSCQLFSTESIYVR